MVLRCLPRFFFSLQLMFVKLSVMSLSQPLERLCTSLQQSLPSISEQEVKMELLKVIKDLKTEMSFKEADNEDQPTQKQITSVLRQLSKTALSRILGYYI